MADFETTGASSAAPSSGASADTSSSSTASAQASATATPVDTSGAASTPAQSGEPGPIPYQRFKEVNDQLRAAKDWQERHNWAEQFNTDPYTFVDNWVDQLAAHPQYGDKILAKAARMLSSRRGTQQQQQAEQLKADVPIVDGNGNVTGYTYRGDVLDKLLEQKMQERLTPLEQMRTAIEQQAQAAVLQQQADEHAKSTLTELRQDPHFKQHEPKVKKALMDHPEWGDNIHRAYHYVLQTEVLPTFQRTAESNVLGHLKTQAAGGTVNPGSNAPAQTPKFKDFGEALRYFSEHPDEAAVMAKR